MRLLCRGTMIRRLEEVDGLADAAINLTTMYVATDTPLALGCENVAALIPNLMRSYPF